MLGTLSCRALWGDEEQWGIQKRREKLIPLPQQLLTVNYDVELSPPLVSWFFFVPFVPLWSPLSFSREELFEQTAALVSEEVLLHDDLLVQDLGVRVAREAPLGI